MNTYTISYVCKLRFKEFPNFHITKCRKVFNSKTGLIKKSVKNGNSIGYRFGDRFISMPRINESLEYIPEEIELPF